MLIVENAELAFPTLTVRRDVARACCNHAKAALGTDLEPMEFVVGQCAVVVALKVGHRGKKNTISRLDTITKGNRLE
jgi:hypothetical protein